MFNSKVTGFPVHASKAYMGRRGIAPLILDLCTRWGWVGL